MITNVYTLSVNNTRKVNSTQNIETNRHFHGTFVSELTQKLQNRKLKIKECKCYKLFKIRKYKKSMVFFFEHSFILCILFRLSILFNYLNDLKYESSSCTFVKAL